MEQKVDKNAGSARASAPSVKVALIQHTALQDIEENLATVSQMIEKAAKAGAVYIQTPEVTDFMAETGEQFYSNLFTEEEHPSLSRMQALAKSLSLTIHLGSITIKSTGAARDRASNRSYIINEVGEITARYNKLHMFDVDVPNGESFRESEKFAPGHKAVIADSPIGKIGLSICYDLRFPTLYRELAQAGASVLTCPAAFTKKSGEAHWNILIRARAIENGAWMLAANQCGNHYPNRNTYGHSLIVDPFGRIIAQGGDEPTVVMASINPAQSNYIRSMIPSLWGDTPFEHAAKTANTEHPEQKIKAT